jgi:hypothetical protein
MRVMTVGELLQFSPAELQAYVRWLTASLPNFRPAARQAARLTLYNIRLAITRRGGPRPG